MAIFDLALTDLAKPLRIIYPESQNMGIPAINPVRPKAAAAFFSAVFDKINLARLKAPPVLSSITAIIAPVIIRNPMEPIVEPKPSLIILITSLPGNAVTARKSEARKSEINAFSLNFDVSIITTAILVLTKTVVINRFIIIFDYPFTCFPA